MTSYDNPDSNPSPRQRRNLAKQRRAEREQRERKWRARRAQKRGDDW